MQPRKIITIVLCLYVFAFSQVPVVNKIEPPNWWEGMATNKIQLMVYGDNLDNIKASFNKDGIKILKINHTPNKSYAFIDVEINKNIDPSDYKLIIENNSGKVSYNFPILKREKDKKLFKGFNNTDAIYLIMPDRFADGNTKNNNIPGFRDLQEFSLNGRHGGDLEGIIDHLDYLKQLGITTLWLTPVVVNNTTMSYHGYVSTNFYDIDPRLGSLDLYKKLVKTAHKKGIKVIVDHVANHFTIDHPWIQNLPMPDWINGSPKNHLPARHYKEVFSDIHADSVSMMNVNNGWFTDYMVDINERNPYVQNYIIQNTIWWVETAGLDGIREDTYPYNDLYFMSKWAKTILTEYPELNIVGEVWTGDFAFLSSFQKGSFYKKDFDSNLPSVTDFPMHDAFSSYASGKTGLNGIYESIAKDFIYPNPDNLMTFLDNHDISRVGYYAKDDQKTKECIFMLMTLRGIPQILYGTEIGIKGGTEHGEIRQDFPGGFPNSDHNAFTEKGRTAREKEFYNYTSKLLKLRKEYAAISKGKLVHFPINNGCYVYFKEDSKNEIMCVVKENKNSKPDLTMYSDKLLGVKEFVDLFSGEKIKRENLSSKLETNGPFILLLKK